MSIPQILNMLSGIKEVVLIYPKKGQSKKDRQQMLTSEQKKLLEVLGLKKHS